MAKTIFITILQLFNSELAQAQLDFLAFGDLRGYIEPCGCDPATDLGGIARLGAVLEKERLFHSNFLVLSLGNTVSSNVKDKEKNPFLMKAMTLLKPDAYLLNVLELQNLGHFTPRVPWVLTNLRKKETGVNSVIIKKKVSIFGYTSHVSTQDKIHSIKNKNEQRRWQRLVISYKAKKVLLFSGPESDLEVFLKLNIFDEIIASNMRSFSDVAGQEEKLDETLLLRASSPKIVFQVPLAGQGILRGGKLRFKIAPKITDLFVVKKPPAGIKSPIIMEPLRNFTWLDRSFQAMSHPFHDLLLQYTKRRSQSFRKGIQMRLSHLANTDFAGASVCQSCHHKAYNIWKQSSHASAYQTLKNVNKNQDSECVSCHVLGFAKKGGFVSEMHSPQFKGVQCENCHGARKAHATNPEKTKKSNSAKDFCTNCHHPPHSSAFVYENYWKKIKHGHN